MARLVLAAARPPAADTIPDYLGFGFDLLRLRLGAAPADNLSLSPVSAGLALSVAALGAQGQTQSEMFHAMGFGQRSADAVARANEQSVNALSNVKGVELEIANAVWVDQSLTVDPNYARRMEHTFHAEVAPAALRTPAGVEAINRWVAEHTHNRIDKILDQPREDAAAFIANAAYFKGTWVSQFSKKATRPEPFYQAGRSARDVPTMHATIDASYVRAGKVQVARLPYRGGRFEMVIVLPDSGVPIAKVAERLSDADWQRWIGLTKPAELNAALPRFKLETDMSLAPDLQALGMRLAFDRDRADFSPMFVKLAQRAFISEVRQKAWIAVDEEGTEAAAATGVTMGLTSARVAPPPVPFIVNRPFLYAVRDGKTGLVLFLGLVQRIADSG